MRERVGALVAERERLAGELALIPGITVFPSGANFVLVRFDGDGHALWQRLVDRGVLVRDFSRWPRVEDCLRITVGTPDEDDRLLESLRDVVSIEPERV
jgi:histidinol-phosphate aminotransferase